MGTLTHGQRNQGFTRLDLGAVLAVLGLLAAVAGPALGVSVNRSARVVCVNNLRQIGSAFHLWANDHGNQNPWWVPYPEGTRGFGPAATAWFQFGWISNQLAAPTLLVCPSDPDKRVARTWSFGVGGLFNSANRNNAVSYFISLDTSRLSPQSSLCGDRNVRAEGFGNCHLGMQNLPFIVTRPVVTAWTNHLHGATGNLLLMDGRVVQASTGRLREIMVADGWNGVNHILKP